MYMTYDKNRSNGAEFNLGSRAAKWVTAKNQAIMIVIHDCIFDFPVFIGFEALWISAKYDNIPFIFVTTGFMDRRQILLILSKFKRINYLLLPLNSLENLSFFDNCRRNKSWFADIRLILEVKFGDDPLLNLKTELKNQSFLLMFEATHPFFVKKHYFSWKIC